MRTVGTGKASVEIYKDKSYLSVDLGAGDYVYNTLQMNQTERVARRMADAIGSVKSLYRAVGTCPEGVHGIKVTFLASYKNFLREYERGADNVQAYFPCELIAKFQEADITSQALVTGSVVIVDGDRIEVSLTQ
jgi:hypothetical protein